MAVPTEKVNTVNEATIESTATPSGRLWSSAQAMPALPLVASVVARPQWLLAGALQGALLGALLAGSSTFTASTVLQLTDVGTDSLRVKQVAQTVQRLANSSPVIAAAASARKSSPADLDRRASAKWELDTELVTVSVTASSPRAAVADANAVAAAAVQVNRNDVQVRLAKLRKQANALVVRDVLTNTEAENARLAQLGQSLASRQADISADTEGINVVDPALIATAAGLGRGAGGLVGLLAGILLATLLAVLAGARGLRVRSDREVGALLPGVELCSPQQAGQVAGQLVESGHAFLAVVCLPGAYENSVAFAADVADFLKHHGRSVTLIDTTLLPTTQARRDVLRYHRPDDVRHILGSDVVVVVVNSEDDACGMLVGQSSLRAAVVVRRGQTGIGPLAQSLSALKRAQPVVILAQ